MRYVKLKTREGAGFHTSIAGDMGSIPGWGTKIPHTTQYGEKRLEKVTHCEDMNQLENKP